MKSITKLRTISLNKITSFSMQLLILIAFSITFGMSTALASSHPNAKAAVQAVCPVPGAMAYVNADAPAGGDGSSSSPFNSLFDAEAAGNWNTLVVMPSATPLVGKIMLADCQHIKGQGPNPVKSNSPNVATIHGAPGLRDAITLTGNHIIENIKIVDADRASIQFGDILIAPFIPTVENASINKVLVVNSNKGDYLDLFDFFEAGAMTGVTVKNGLLDILNSRIDGAIGSGLAFNQIFGERVTTVKNTTIQNLVGTTGVSNFGIPLSSGISMFSAGFGAAGKFHLEVDNVLIDNITVPVNRGGDTLGIAVEDVFFSSPFTEASATIRNSTISNINGSQNAVHMYGHGTATATYIVENTVIDGAGAAGIYVERMPHFFDSAPAAARDMNVIIRNNKISNTKGSGILTFGFLEGHHQYEITNNSFENIGRNVMLFFGESFSGFPVYKTGYATIKHNKAINYGYDTAHPQYPFYGGIAILTIFGDWEKLEILAEKNCFKNGPFGLLDVDGSSVFFANVLDAGGGPLGSKGMNSFVNMSLGDILQSSVSVSAQNNYWSGGTANVVGGTADTSNERKADSACVGAGYNGKAGANIE